MTRDGGRRSRPPRPIIGWREWVSLPGLGIDSIKAKIDTGARSSALHAHRLRIGHDDGGEVAHFEVHPLQRTAVPSLPVQARVVDWRHVTSSAGHRELRPVIVTDVEFGAKRWSIEVTLTNRDSMGFRLLLGRQAVRRKFLVDPGRSFLGRKNNNR